MDMDVDDDDDDESLSEIDSDSDGDMESDDSEHRNRINTRRRKTTTGNKKASTTTTSRKKKNLPTPPATKKSNNSRTTAAAAAAAGVGAAAGSSQSSRSKLAREHKITAVQEQEILQVFKLFAEEHEGIKSTVISPPKSKKTTRKKQKTASPIAKLRVSNLRPALTALSLTPTSSELREYIAILDPEGEGLVDFEPFVAICALKINSRIVNHEDHQREVDEAWELFVKNGEDRITLASLREVARGIGEGAVSDDLLQDMVLEANGGVGLARGVEKEEFENIMRRAGVWR